MFDRFNRQVDVETRPVKVVGRRPEHIDDFTDRCFGKPRKLLEGHEELPAIEVQPEAVPGDACYFNLFGGRATALQFRHAAPLRCEVSSSLRATESVILRHLYALLKPVGVTKPPC